MPPPSLSWWRDTELIDDTYEEVNGQTINTLEMKNVTREDQETVMECRLAELFLRLCYIIYHQTNQISF